MTTSTPLHIEDAGAGDPVVLLHSSGLSGRQWRRLSSELQRLSESLPDAGVVTASKAGHLGPLTHADLVNGLVLRALGG